MDITKLQAKKLLLDDQVIAVPTETVYGLAASIYSEKGIRKIFNLKKRSLSNPLIIHISQYNQFKNLTSISNKEIEKIIEAFWPGPLTIIAPAKVDQVSATIRANFATVAIRMPKHPDLQKLIDEVGPIVAPSANLSGKPSSTKKNHVLHDFGLDFPILEGEEPDCGIESTIIGYVDGKWQLFRLGYISQEEIENVLGCPLIYSSLTITPGRMFKHYSPNAELSTSLSPDRNVEAIIGFDDRTYPKSQYFFSMGSSTNSKLIAKSLYSILRKLDELNISRAWIDTNFTSKQLFTSIKERIKRASAREPYDCTRH